jgi:hypothetical protein
VLRAALVGVELVTRDETRTDAAGNRPKLAVANQGAHVVLAAVELGGEVADGQAD